MVADSNPLKSLPIRFPYGVTTAEWGRPVGANAAGRHRVAGHRIAAMPADRSHGLRHPVYQDGPHERSNDPPMSTANGR
jgi:hypothetical protein